MSRLRSFLCCCTLLLALPAGAQTVVPPTTLTTDTVWTLAGSPYVLAGDVTVAYGATLTVEPGVVVRANLSRGLTVKGTLRALGSATQPILFTADQPVRGRWLGLWFLGEPALGRPSTRSILEYVTVEYGKPDIRVTDADVQISNSTIREASDDGVSVGANGVAHISDTALTNNSGYAVEYTNTARDARLGRLTATGNGTNAIRLLGATLSGEHRWEFTGLPYIAGDIAVAEGALLAVEPGVVVQFETPRSLTVRGRIRAIGTAAQKVVFTGRTAARGSWNGLWIVGTPESPIGGSTLDHVVVEYATTGLRLTHATVRVLHSVVRYNSVDGVLIDFGGAGSYIEDSDIVDNTGYGVRSANATIPFALAANNWWGSASGPTADVAQCNAGGTGSRVGARIAFKPFLLAADVAPDPVPKSQSPVVSIDPDRWFAPADGIPHIYVRLTLRDGGGRPMQGRTVTLLTDRGTATSGGVTDVEGRTFAYLRSSVVGDANLAAQVDTSDPCEYVRGGSARVTFTAPVTTTSLMPIKAPYAAERITASPEPLTRGVPTTITARLSNANDFPMTVSATFGIAQLGIGLTFGPLGTVVHTIPPKSDKDFSVQWTPVLSGHYCFEVTYYIQEAPAISGTVSGPTHVAGRSTGSSGRNQRNFNTSPGSKTPPSEKNSIQKARQITGALNNGSTALTIATNPAGVPAGMVQGSMLGAMLDRLFDGFQRACDALLGDPPRLDYKLIAVVQPLPFVPVDPVAGVSEARRLATNEMQQALLDAAAKLDAAALSIDRYAGATAANDLQWASQQFAAYAHYKRLAGQALGVAALKIDTYVNVHEAEHIDLVITPGMYQQYQNRLAATGFTEQEREAARLLGRTEDELEASRQERLALDPEEQAGSLLAALRNLSAAFRQVWEAELGADMFSSGDMRDPSALGATHGGLARTYDTIQTLTIGNPTSARATIDLQVRRIDLPPDWIVEVEPSSLTLDPGQTREVTVNLQAGAPAAQGTVYRAAVEGYIGGQLMGDQAGSGGVVFDVMIPEQATFGGASDSDADGMPDAWETANGLDPTTPDDANEDPDGDGVTNLGECLAGTDPHLSNVWNLSEGATGFFDERLAVVNAGTAPATFAVRFLTSAGESITLDYELGAMRRMTIPVNDVPGLQQAEVSAVVTSTRGNVVVERTMLWNANDASNYEGHTGKGIAAARTRWYLAEGDANFFDTWILFANATATTAQVSVTYLLPGGATIPASYSVAPNSRLTIFANDVPGLRGSAFSTVIDSTVPITVERSMYFTTDGRLWTGGHGSAAVDEPATSWLVAEGRTGPMFDTYLLLANPGASETTATVRYMKPGGHVVESTYLLPQTSRTTVYLDAIPGLEDTDVSASIEAGSPIIVERAMYWPGAFVDWYGAHNSVGLTSPGTRWALAEGEVGGPDGFESWILLANPGSAPADVTLTFLREGQPPTEIHRTVPGNARLTISAAEGDTGLASGEKFGALVESTQPIAVERAMYWNALGQFWAGGTNETGIKLR